jgi:hypothetical protein
MAAQSRFVDFWRSGLLGLVGITAASWANAEILNDGTTTNRLVRLANQEQTTGGNITVIQPDAGGSYLVAEQIDLFGGFSIPALRTAWYPSNARATGTNYQITAEFQPAAASPANQGGVMGWLNTVSSNGILLKIVPGSGGEPLPVSFQVSHVDFKGLSAADNENLEFLYDLEGNPASGSFTSAWSEPTGYDPSQFARLELGFATPTVEDLAAVTNATVTARVTARVFQGDLSGTPTQVGRTIELLTSLPVPPADQHRMGYFGVWASIFGGNVIGNYRNLEAEGEIEIIINELPMIVLTQPAPGAIRTAPATFLIEADATDSDGTIISVEFFEGTNSLGTIDTPPFVWTWSGVMEGSYSLSAVATDNIGESTVSSPVEVTVLPWSGTAPELSVTVTGDTLHLSWSGTGFQLQYKTDLDGAAWIDVPNTTGVTQIDLSTSLGAQYFRLVGSGTPSGPVLEVAVTAGSVTVSWPAGTTGYRLQAKTALGDAVWTEIPTTTNSHTESIVGGTRFYRLIQ